MVRMRVRLTADLNARPTFTRPCSADYTGDLLKSVFADHRADVYNWQVSLRRLRHDSANAHSLHTLHKHPVQLLILRRVHDDAFNANTILASVLTTKYLVVNIR